MTSINSIQSEVTTLTERLEYLASRMGYQVETPSIKRGAAHAARSLQALAAAATQLADKYEAAQWYDQTDAADMLSEQASTAANKALLLANAAAMDMAAF